MKIEYFDLISPEPLYFQGIGGIKSPTLREISKLSYNAYQWYLTLLLMTPQTYYEVIGQSEYFESLTDDELQQLDIFGLIVENDEMLKIIENALSFFFVENVRYDESNKAFLTYIDESPVGAINRNTWDAIIDIISQRNNIQSKPDDITKAKNKRGIEIFKKIQRYKSAMNKNIAPDKNIELGNVISAIANRSNTLDILNIWDVTIFQLWDAFYRISSNNMYDIQATTVAVWGDEKKTFNSTAWLERPTSTNKNKKARNN